MLELPNSRRVESPYGPFRRVFASGQPRSTFQQWAFPVFAETQALVHLLLQKPAAAGHRSYPWKSTFNEGLDESWKGWFCFSPIRFSPSPAG